MWKILLHSLLRAGLVHCPTVFYCSTFLGANRVLSLVPQSLSHCWTNKNVLKFIEWCQMSEIRDPYFVPVIWFSIHRSLITHRPGKGHEWSLFPSGLHSFFVERVQSAESARMHKTRRFVTPIFSALYFLPAVFYGLHGQGLVVCEFIFPSSPDRGPGTSGSSSFWSQICRWPLLNESIS